jgi:hypothetical protein
MTLPGPVAGSELFNPDDLEEELWRCCHATGHNDPELPADLVGVVRHYIDERLRAGDDLTVADVEFLVVRILKSLGLEAAARLFCHDRGMAPPPPAGIIVAADAAAITAALAGQADFLGRPLTELSERVARALRTLHVDAATPQLVAELARCLEANANGAGSAWAIHRDELQTIAPDPLRAAVSEGIVRMRSVSRLFPSVVLLVDLPRMATALGDNLLPELQFVPAFDQLCSHLQLTVQAVSRTAKSRASNLQGQRISASVAFQNFTVLAAGRFLLSRTTAAALQQELSAVADWRLDNVRYDFE